MTATPAAARKTRRLSDHSADARMLMLAAASVAIGSGSAFGALVLLKLIYNATNLLWLADVSFVSRQI
jgi:hypothetical protein